MAKKTERRANGTIKPTNKNKAKKAKPTPEFGGVPIKVDAGEELIAAMQTSSANAIMARFSTFRQEKSLDIRVFWLNEADTAGAMWLPTSKGVRFSNASGDQLEGFMQAILDALNP